MSEMHHNIRQEQVNSLQQPSRTRRALAVAAITAAGVSAGGLLGFLTGDHSAAELRKEALVVEVCADALEDGSYRAQDTCGLTYNRFEESGLLDPEQMRGVAELARIEAEQSNEHSAAEQALLFGVAIGMTSFIGAVIRDGVRYHPNV